MGEGGAGATLSLDGSSGVHLWFLPVKIWQAPNENVNEWLHKRLLKALSVPAQSTIAHAHSKQCIDKRLAIFLTRQLQNYFIATRVSVCFYSCISGFLLSPVIPILSFMLISATRYLPMGHELRLLCLIKVLFVIGKRKAYRALVSKPLFFFQPM